MTPSADSANPPARIKTTAPQVLGLLDDGELILLAVKPSAWFLLLSSGPVLATAAAVAGANWAAHEWLGLETPRRMIYLACLAACLARVMWASAQWMGRLYLLTSRRVVTVGGVGTVRIDQCALERIDDVSVSTTTAEKPLGLATIVCRDSDTPPAQVAWVNIAQPAHVREMIAQAIRRAGRGPATGAPPGR